MLKIQTTTSASQNQITVIQQVYDELFFLLLIYDLTVLNNFQTVFSPFTIMI